MTLLCAPDGTCLEIGGAIVVGLGLGLVLVYGGVLLREWLR